MLEPNESAPSAENRLEEFERRWQRGDFPDVVQFLIDSGDLSANPTFVTDLTELDLEYRWRSSKTSEADQTTLDTKAGLPAFPAVVDYLAALPGFPTESDLRVRLLKAEYKVRQRYGDQATMQLVMERNQGVIDFDAARKLCAQYDEETLDETFVPGSGKHRSRFVGNYKILQKIAEGGMGAVYMAEQEEPIRRRVALKIIRSGLDTGQIIARFEAERQALAMMDHPNIARILDAGTTGDGAPYFVMELVKGVPLTEYCDRNRLSIRERLELFVPVCRAVQHAHLKGIIHRDLKPSNVLIALHDGVPVPKVIDFGLAKATEHQTRLTDRTMFTEYGQVVGTLQYMSPEQAEMNQLDVDTRTDVYSLGVMLYELLTGSTPLERETLHQHALLAVLDMIRENEPPRPSTRLSESGDAAAGASRHRQLEPARLQQLLKGELDWIVMRSLEKDRVRRYETPSAFADDLLRYLNDDEVQARPPSMAYRLVKSLRRHRTAFTVALIMSLILVAGVLGTTAMWLKAERIAGEKASEAIRAQQAEAAAAKSAREERLAREQTDREKQNVLVARRKLESSLSRSNFLLAGARWTENRPAEARDILERVPESHRRLEWYLANHTFQGGDFVFRGHTDGVNSVDVTPDGGMLVSTSADGTIRLWDAVEGGMRRKLPVPPDCRWIGGGFSADGSLLVAVSHRGKFCVWELATGNQKSVEQIEGEVVDARLDHATDQLTICIARDTDGAEPGQGTVRRIEVRSIRQPDSVMFHLPLAKSVDSATLNPDGTVIATAAGNGQVSMISTSTGKRLSSLKLSTAGTIVDLQYSPDGTRLIAAIADDGGYSVFPGAIEVWQPEEKKCIFECSIPERDPSAVAISPDGRFLLMGGSDGSIQIWDLLAGNRPWSVIGHSADVTGIRFSQDGSRFFSASSDTTLRSWTLSDMFSDWSLLETGTEKWSFSADGETGVRYTEQGAASVLEVRRLRDNETLFRHGVGHGATISVSPDGRRVAVGESGKVRIFDVERARQLGEFQRKNRKCILHFSRDGRTLYANDNVARQELLVWDVEKGIHKERIPYHGTDISMIRIDPADQVVVTVANDVNGEWLKVWRSDQSDPIVTRENALITHGTLNSDGQWIAVCNGRDLELRDTSDGQLIWSKHHRSLVTAVAFSPDSSRIVMSALDGTVRILDRLSGEQLLIFPPWRSRDNDSFYYGEQIAVSTLDIVTLWSERDLHLFTREEKPLTIMRGQQNRK